MKKKITAIITSAMLALSICTPAMAFAAEDGGQSSVFVLTYQATPVSANAEPMPDVVEYAVPSRSYLICNDELAVWTNTNEDGSGLPYLRNMSDTDLVLDVTDMVIEPLSNIAVNGIAPAEGVTPIGSLDISIGLSTTDGISTPSTPHKPHAAGAAIDKHEYMDFAARSDLFVNTTGTLAPDLSANGSTMTVAEWAQTYLANMSDTYRVTWNVYPKSQVEGGTVV